MPESAQEELIVLPKRSMKYGMISISILTLGFGVAMGTLVMGSTVGVIALVICVIASRILGYFVNKQESITVRHFGSEKLQLKND